MGEESGASNQQGKLQRYLTDRCKIIWRSEVQYMAKPKQYYLCSVFGCLC